LWTIQNVLSMSKSIENSINRFVVGLIRDAVSTKTGAHNTT